MSSEADMIGYRIAAALERLVALQEAQVVKAGQADESFQQMVRMIQEMEERSRLRDFATCGPAN